jgi:plasmid replication initiation protein
MATSFGDFEINTGSISLIKDFIGVLKQQKFSEIELRIIEILIKNTKREDLSLTMSKTVKSYFVSDNDIKISCDTIINQDLAFSINKHFSNIVYSHNGSFNAFFVSCSYNNNIFEFGLNSFFINQFLNIKEFFDNFNLHYLLSMKNFSSMLLYKSLRECGDLKYEEFTIQELKDKLCLDGKYSQYGPLKLRVIDTAIEDINRHSELLVKLVEIKTRQKITKLKFTWTYKDNQELQVKKLFAAFAKKHRKHLGVLSSRDVNLNNSEILSELELFIFDNITNYKPLSLKPLELKKCFSIDLA